uniref:contactin-associated protein like 5-3-like isoform X2 n=1 Tax=Ciona intestinalis TaxID=7719 RepID=UPI000EF52829|nr:contactin-associated protein like 5-3-like isoform X2 [Ciona intestinalis]|eukprot:XP_026689783.1 contactin-associated protein like 5-3-like isoform X2 [Ciona intestinalis]
MLVLCLYIVVIFVEQVPTVVSNQQHHCPGYTVVQNFGPDAVPNLTQNHTRGAPGKVGKKGPKGDIGEKGAKGEAGITPHYNEIGILKRQVAQLMNRIDMMGIQHKSCEHVNGTEVDSGLYQIKPGSRPFVAHCSFNETHRFTRIGHDAESEIQVSSCEDPLCYSRNIAYEVSMAQIVALISVSRHCRQFVKYRCRGSVLNSGTPFAGWKSRDGLNQHNWGGTSRTGWCACGETGTCLDRTKKCNCDDNSSSTADEGYLTNKALLPVTAVMFGDATAPSEAGWHTVGPLECWGRN